MFSEQLQGFACVTELVLSFFSTFSSSNLKPSYSQTNLNKKKNMEAVQETFEVQLKSPVFPNFMS